MGGTFSGYLSIYNDWDILPAALRSVAPYLDELVVVDGAYDWMAPYLEVLGVNPARSVDEVYSAIESSGIPFRIISRTWKNEIEKRLAGYEACAYDYVFRVDADEIMFFDEVNMQAALSSGLEVGSMEMPTYIAPGWISCAREMQKIERQCFLFNQRKVSPQIHLNYLWLVLTADRLPSAEMKPYEVHSEPLAFNAHLTGWRTPKTSTNRASFYVLNWMRQHGVPWIPSLSNKPLTDLRDLFNLIQPLTFLSSLSMGEIALGMTESIETRSLRPTPLRADQEATFSYLYDDFLTSLALSNIELVSKGRTLVKGMPILIDLSTAEARDAIAPKGVLILRFTARLLSAKAKLITYADSYYQAALACELTETDLRSELTFSRPQGLLRQCLEIQVWPDTELLFLGVQAIL